VQLPTKLSDTARPIGHKHMAGEEEEKCCRICLEPDKRCHLIAPCACSGSQKWVHRECLNRWRITREDRAFSRCTECLTSYTLISPKDEKNVRFWGRIRFYGACLRDILIALSITFLIIICLGLLVSEMDGTKSLPHLFALKHRFRLFYFGCGLFLFLASVGISASFFLCCNRQDRHGSSNDCLCDCCPSNTLYGPLYLSPDPSARCCCCCCEGSHDCSPLCCTTCESGSLCEGCTAASCEQEALVFLLIGLLIFAVIGIFVSVFVGVYFVQKVTNSHIHFLHKQVLAKDYIVKDLDQDPLTRFETESCGSEGEGKGDIELGEARSILLEGVRQRDMGGGDERNHGRSFGSLSATQQQELDRLGLL
jgi:hypothetical protein